MASNITKAPLLRALAVRGYSTCPQGNPVSGTPDYSINTTTLPNKVVVASAENEAAISRLSVVFRAGSRNETPDNAGTVHVLRICAGLSTRTSTQFAITRNLQQAGASLVCATDRETISYTLTAPRPSFGECLSFLGDVAARQCFRPWEVSDNTPRLRLELATRPPQLRAVDLLHKAAFRGRNLGNSLYIAKHQIGKISAETLQHYVGQYFTAERAAVVGLGIDQEAAVNFAKCLQLEGGCQPSHKAVYTGGEIRSDKGGDLAHVAIAGEGGALTNAKEALAFAVLQRALGVGSYIKYNNENKSVLAKAISCGASPSSMTALNVMYSDVGLFGVLISAPRGDAGVTVESAMKVLKSGNVSEEDIQRGKKQLKTAILLEMESGCTAIQDMGTQAVLTGCVSTACQMASAIDAVSSSDVCAAAKKVANSKFSMASVGNLACVPFLAELK